MADPKDYYELLEVSKTADAAEIKAAYRRQAFKFHPDKNPGNKTAEANFKAINEAYEALSDPEKRAAYDQMGANWKNGQQFEPPPNWNAGFEFGVRGEGFSQGFNGGFGQGFDQAQSSAHSDFFESLFGQAR